MLSVSVSRDASGGGSGGGNVAAAAAAPSSSSLDEANVVNTVLTTASAAIDWRAVRLAPHMRATLRRARAAALAHNVSNFDGFGSFHSDDVEDLIEQSASEYVPPSCLPLFAQRILSRPELHALVRALDTTTTTTVVNDARTDVTTPLRHGGTDSDDDSDSRAAMSDSDDGSATSADDAPSSSHEQQQQQQQQQRQQAHSDTYRSARRRYRSASPPQQQSSSSSSSQPRSSRARVYTASFAETQQGGAHAQRHASAHTSAAATTAAAAVAATVVRNDAGSTRGVDDGNDADGADTSSEPPLPSPHAPSCASSASGGGSSTSSSSYGGAAAAGGGGGSDVDGVTVSAARVRVAATLRKEAHSTSVLLLLPQQQQEQEQQRAHDGEQEPQHAVVADVFDVNVMRAAHALAAATTTTTTTRATQQLLRHLYTTPVAPCAMGATFRATHFTLRDAVVFVNQGAFGSALAGALAMKHAYELHAEAEVVEYVDRQLLPLLVHSTRVLADFLHADARQLVLVQNATFALNAAMRLIRAGDVVAFLDTEYLAVYKMMWFRCSEVGASLHEVRLCKYLHDAAVLGDDAALTREVLRQLPPGCTTVVVDLIASTTALALPVLTHLVPALRRCGVRDIIVDGAHGPLQMPLNFAALPAVCQPSVFVGNLHKWFCAPKSVGFLWVRNEDKERVRSVVVSHGAGNGMLSEFIWEGTRDCGAFLCVPALVRFWQAQDCARVQDYCSSLLTSAATMLTMAFRSRPVARHAPFMALVELPEELQDAYITGKYIQDTLHDTFAIEVPVKQVEGRYYVRLSAFVYNTPDEYVYLRDAVLLIADKWFRSELRRSMALAQYAATMQPSHSTTILTGQHNNNSSDSGSGSDVTAAASSTTAAAGVFATSTAAQHSGGEGTASATATTMMQGSVPCDERLRRMGGCGVVGLDPTLKRRKTRKFA